jgi:hypothetical protein
LFDEIGYFNVGKREPVKGCESYSSFETGSGNERRVRGTRQFEQSAPCFGSAYDDLHEHCLTGKHALTSEGEMLVDRCILFLNTNLEYMGEINFISFLAPIKKLWR